MNNEEFLRGREIYNKLVEEKNEQEKAKEKHLLEINAKINELMQDENVKEYVKLYNEKRMLNEKNLTDALFHNEGKKNLMYQAFADVCNSTIDSNNIYVFMGYSQPDTNSGLRMYKNLENLYVEYVSESYLSRFEEKNKVIYPNCNDKKAYFEWLREMFFCYLANFPQEEAVQYVLKITNNKI